MSSWPLMPIPPTFRATSVQACGLWPFAGGSSRPTVGVPVGHDLQTGSTVCCDAFAWFRAGFISSPSKFILGMPGLGKSSYVCRQIIGLADRGITSMITDLKGEYSKLTLELGGQVMEFGKSYRLNLLDLGAMGDAAKRIGGKKGAELREIAIERAVDMVVTQIQIVRRERVQDWEYTLLSNVTRALHNRPRARKAPTLLDLSQLLQTPTDDMLRAVLVFSVDDYLELTTRLRRSVQAVLEGPLGRMYDGQSTQRLSIDVPAVSIDISAVARQQNESVLASAMLASWSETFGAIHASNALTDAGLAPQRNYVTVLDEMWKAMRIEGAGLVDQADSITRLNRNDGTGHIFVSHSLRDMESMTSEADNMKARGFVERSGIVVTAGLAKEDLYALSKVKRMSNTEIDTVAAWSTPPGWRPRFVRGADGVSRPAPPPGAGKVLIKVGERAGIQTQVKLTQTELDLHDTNGRWLTEAAR